MGRREVAGLDTVYLVLPDADEKLAAVVPERPLEWEEAAEVLHSCEKGLAHLHAHGLLHGCVSPQTVEAVGYSVQLNTESVYRIGKTPRIQWSKPQYLAPESKNLNLTTAADVWCLGATLFEVLAQEPYGTPGAELDKGLPLAAVIQRCLEKNPLTRCALKEASSVARGAIENGASAHAHAPPEPLTASPVQPEPAAKPPQASAAAPRAEAKTASRQHKPPPDYLIPSSSSQPRAPLAQVGSRNLSRQKNRLDTLRKKKWRWCRSASGIGRFDVNLSGPAFARSTHPSTTLMRAKPSPPRLVKSCPRALRLWVVDRI